MALRETYHNDASSSSTRTIKISNFPSELSVGGWFATLRDVNLAARLSGRVDADWVVVGGGWFGINAARRIAELRRQDSVVLIDAVEIGNNAAGRCAGYAIDLAHNPRNANFAEDEKGNIEERNIKIGARDRIDHFRLVLAVGLKRQLGGRCVHHPALHWNDDLLHSVPQTCLNQGVDSSSGQG